VTIHLLTRRDTDTSVEAPAWADLASVRLAVVLWGGLGVVDLCRLAHAPSYVCVAALAMLVAASSWGMRGGTALVTALVGWLLVDGFVEHRYGVLGFDGLPDLARFAVLVGVAVLATRVHR
jgi:hypothetical protein